MEKDVKVVKLCLFLVAVSACNIRIMYETQRERSERIEMNISIPKHQRPTGQDTACCKPQLDPSPNGGDPLQRFERPSHTRQWIEETKQKFNNHQNFIDLCQFSRKY